MDVEFIWTDESAIRIISIWTICHVLEGESLILAIKYLKKIYIKGVKTEEILEDGLLI